MHKVYNNLEIPKFNYFLYILTYFNKYISEIMYDTILYCRKLNFQMKYTLFIQIHYLVRKIKNLIFQSILKYKECNFEKMLDLINRIYVSNGLNNLLM